ncbi:MAG: hypothetical protein ABEI86_02400, partial [Halobacteriaceae archaeon]
TQVANKEVLGETIEVLPDDDMFVKSNLITVIASFAEQGIIIDESIDVLERFLDADEPAIRLDAARGLGMIAERDVARESSIEPLQELTNDTTTIEVELEDGTQTIQINEIAQQTLDTVRERVE